MRYTRAFILCAVLVNLVGAPLVHAEEINIRPFLLDVELEPRAQATREVTISSEYPTRTARIFATVNEISLAADGEIKAFQSPIGSDRANTVTSWIEVTRGRIEVPAGESITVPIGLHVHPFAEPGEYHAFIGFVEAPNRPAAERTALAGDADGVILKVTIPDERVSALRLERFSVERFVTAENNREIAIALENTGDLPATPSGEIIFYDARGAEVTAVPVNIEGVTIAPGAQQVLRSQVPIDAGMGRYKANVALAHNPKMTASVYDTAFFYYISPPILFAILGGILLLTALVVWLFRRTLLTEAVDDESGSEVLLFVRDGHAASPQDHDINLKQTTVDSTR